MEKVYLPRELIRELKHLTVDSEQSLSAIVVWHSRSFSIDADQGEWLATRVLKASPRPQAPLPAPTEAVSTREPIQIT